MTSKTGPLPEGLTLGRKIKNWYVGRLLGTGACGSVHELLSVKENQKKYAVKLVMNPPTTGGRVNKKNKAQQHNSNLLHYESLIYTAHLPDLSGDMIPSIPTKGPPFYGQVKGTSSAIEERHIQCHANFA